jgi:hypothetical protein
MALQNDTSRIQYNGNNSTSNSYAIPFVFFENSHIKCVVTTSAGVDTELTLGSTFNVTGAGNANGGSLTTTTAVPTSSKVTIFRNVPATQTTSYQEGGDFPAASHERALDKLTMIAQQTKRLADRALKVPETQNNPNDIPNAGSGKKLLGIENGSLTWEENRQLPSYPLTTGQQILSSAGSGAAPSWQSLPSLAIGPITATDSTTARFVQDRFAEKVNVKDFGAVGDGVANDQPAIQAAINAAPANSIIYFPKGTYFLGANAGLTVSKNLAFVGEANVSTVRLNKLVAIGFRLQQGCSFAGFENLTIDYTEGWYNSGTYAQGGGPQVAIHANGINLDAELHINNCTIKDIVNAMYAASKFRLLIIRNTQLLYKHGFASCRWYTPTGADIGHPTQVLLGCGETTVIQNCYFDGLIDPTFTGVQGNPPDSNKSPVDGIYFTAGFSPMYQEISNCVALNIGIEGIMLAGIGQTRAYYDDASQNKTVSSFVITNAGAQGNATWPKLGTVTVNNHGYKVGDIVYISGASTGNGHWMVHSVAQNTFTVLMTGGTNGTATGTIIANVSRAPRRRVCVVRGNYITSSPHKSAYYSGTQTPIVVYDGAGEVIDITNNTVMGSAGAAVSLISEYLWPSGFTPFTPKVRGNCFEDVNCGISTKGTQVGTVLENNSIVTSSNWAKNQSVWPQNPNAYCFQTPFLIVSADAIIRNNTIRQETPLWDAVLTVTQRNAGSNSFTVTDGSLISNNLSPLNYNNQQDYGVITAFANGKVNAFPVTGVSGNTVTINVDWFVNQTDFTTGAAYWAKTAGDNWARQAAFAIASNVGRTVEIENNRVVNPVHDVLPTGGIGTVYIIGNMWFDAKSYVATNVTRYGDEYRNRSSGAAGSLSEYAEVFVDDFQRANVSGANLGTSTSGHAVVATGAGVSNIAIQDGKLKFLNSGGAAYVWPSLTQPVRRFGCTFTVEQTNNGGQWVGALLLSSQEQSLNNMLHLVWDANNIGISDWRNGGATQTSIVHEVFSTPLHAGGEYKIEVELFPATNTVVLHTPTGRVLKGTCANLAEYYTPYVAYEWIFNPTQSKDVPSYTKIWALSGKIAKDLFVVQDGVQESTLIDSSKYRENSSYDIPLVNPQSVIANNGSVSWGGYGLRTSHWAQAASYGLANLAGGVTGMPVLFRRTTGETQADMDNFWRSYLLFKFHLKVTGTAWNNSLSKHAVNIGQYWNGNAVGGLDVAQLGSYPSGIGIVAKGNILHACLNSGVAGGAGYVESSPILTMANDKFYEITLEYLGGNSNPPTAVQSYNRKLNVYINGLLKATLSNGPQDSGSAFCYSITQCTWTDQAEPSGYAEVTMRNLRLAFSQKASH